MSTMVLQHGPAPLPYPEPPYGAAPDWSQQSAPAEPPTKTPRGRRWIALSAAAIGVLMIGGAAGFAVGHLAAPEPTVRTLEVPGNVEPQAFTNNDVAWCREYNITTSRLYDQDVASGAPRTLAAPELPAAAWSADERAANHALVARYGRWDAELSSLRSGADNPTLKLLINGMLDSAGRLSTAIANGTYSPTDRNEYRDVSVAGDGLVSMCEALQP